MTAVPPLPTATEGSLRHRVARERRAGFVGRCEELELFDRARRAEPNSPRVLLVHGPGGIGKSALLRRFADVATDTTVVTVDGSQVSDASALERFLVPLRTAHRGVLLIDRFEECTELEEQVREEVLLSLPEDTVVVVAGRWQPDAAWSLDPGWRSVAATVELGTLGPAEADQLLEIREVPGDARGDLVAFARGNPLALHLAVRDWHDDSAPGQPWRPSGPTVQTLREVLVGRAPSVEAEYALRVAGHVRFTTVDLLRAVLEEEQAITAFEWLRSRSWVRTGPSGATADDLVREVLDTDLVWRDPQGHEELHERLWDHLGARVQSAEGEALVAAVSELVRLHRHGTHPVPDLFDADLDDDISEHAYDASMREDVLDLARADGGRELAEHVDRWLELRPGDFSVYRRGEDEALVAFLGLLRIPAPPPDDADPALAAVGRHVERTSAGGPTDRVGIARFVVPRPQPDRSTPAGAHVSLRISVEQVRCAGALAASYLLLPRREEFAPVVAAFDHVLAGPVEGLDDGTWGLFVHDWRDVGLAEHLRRCRPVVAEAVDSVVLAPPPAPALSRPAHDEAVKQVLRDWHDEVALSANPLCSVDVAELRGRVRDAVSALGEDPRRIKQQRAVAATFLDRRTTQQAAAARLGLPFSTFRRHLRRGVDDVADHLWTHRPLSEVVFAGRGARF